MELKMRKPRYFRLDEGQPASTPTPSPIMITTAGSIEPATLMSPNNPSDNHLYFYEDVEPSTTLQLIKSLRSLELGFKREHLERSVQWGTPYPPIWIHIQSDGGDLFSALAVADQIKSMQVPVYSIIEGIAASGATVISAACRQRYMYANSFIMIHQLSSINWGTYEDHKDHINMEDMAMKSLSRFYKKNSKLSKDDVVELLKRNSWMNAKQAKKKGFVDHIIGENDIDDIDYEHYVDRKKQNDDDDD